MRMPWKFGKNEPAVLPITAPEKTAIRKPAPSGEAPEYIVHKHHTTPASDLVTRREFVTSITTGRKAGKKQ